MNSVAINRYFYYRRTLVSIQQLVRLPNLLIIVFSQYLTRIFLIGPKQDWFYQVIDPRMFVLSLSTVLVAAAGYIINDYYDVKIDTINKPQRVIVGRILKRRYAMIAHIFFNLLGIAAGLLISKEIAAINFVSGFLLWLYSNQLKRKPFIGNFTVALLSAASILVVPVYFDQWNYLIFFFAIFAFFISLIREMIKDMEDIRGDKNFGCRTLPIVWGIRKTKNLIYVLLGIFFLSLITMLYLEGNHAVFLYSVAMAIPIFYFIYWLYRSDTQKHFRRLSIFCKLVMLLGLLMMVLV